MSNIEFVDELPNPATGALAKYAGFAETLRNNPGRWAKFPKQGSASNRGSVAYQIKQGKVAGFTKGEYEAVNRDSVMFVRYIGTGKDTAK